MINGTDALYIENDGDDETLMVQKHVRLCALENSNVLPSKRKADGE